MRTLRHTLRISAVFFAALLLSVAFGKRAAPLDVEPIEHAGVRYEAPHWCWGIESQSPGDLCSNGGIVQAFEARTNRLLWTLRIYTTEYDPDLERDVQDVFITSLSIDGIHLIVENEQGAVFAVDLQTHDVSRRE